MLSFESMFNVILHLLISVSLDISHCGLFFKDLKVFFPSCLVFNEQMEDCEDTQTKDFVKK